MPWRVFGLVGLLIVVTAFTAFNLDHRSDVSIGIYTFRSVPVFLTSLVSVTLGALLVVPFMVPRRRRPQPEPQPQPEPRLQLTDESDAVPVARAVPVAEAEDEPAAAAPRGEPEEQAAAVTEGAPEPPARKARRWPLGSRRKASPD